MFNLFKEKEKNKHQDYISHTRKYEIYFKPHPQLITTDHYKNIFSNQYKFLVVFTITINGAGFNKPDGGTHCMGTIEFRMVNNECLFEYIICYDGRVILNYSYGMIGDKLNYESFYKSPTLIDVNNRENIIEGINELNYLLLFEEGFKIFETLKWNLEEIKILFPKVKKIADDEV